MKKAILFISIFSLNFLSAQQKHNSIKLKNLEQEKTFSGKLTGFNNGDKIKFYDPEIMKTLDSTYIVDGKFKLKNPLGKIPKTIFITVVSENKYFTFIPFIAGENIEISGDKKDFKYNLLVNGSKFQKEKELLEKETKKYKIERDSLSKYFRIKQNDTTNTNLEILKKIKNRVNEIDNLSDTITIKYIKEHINTHYYALANLSFYFNKLPKSEIQDLYNKLNKEHQKSVYGKRVKTFLEVGNILKEGDFYFDFEAKGQDNKKHNLSEIKDKYILLDFYETYCGPCAASVSEIKKMAEQYKDKLQIVSFCADKPEDIWRKGINQNKIDWLSLWDGKGTSGSTVFKYGSDGFPTFILIDKMGKIIKIDNSGYGEGSIEKMLKENIK